MKLPKIPENEAQRMATLARYKIIDTLPEQAFDDFTLLASQICNTPIALITFVVEGRQWFKSKVGLDATETSRDVSFCAHAIHSQEIFEVQNALLDVRFKDNPIVLSDPNVRFYAGVPLIAPDGCALGTLCVIDQVSRKLTSYQRQALEILGRQLVAQLELRLSTVRVDALHTALETQALQERKALELLRKVTGRFPGIVYQFRLCPDGSSCFPYASEGMRTIYGVAPEDVLQDAAPAFARMHPEDWPGVVESIAKSAAELSPWRYEYRYQYEDGSMRWLLDEAIPEREPDGSVLWHGFVIDISEQKQTRESLAHVTELLNTTSALSKVGGWELDLRTNRVRWTEQVYYIHELDPSQEPQLEQAIDFYAPEARPTIRAAIDNAMKNGTPWDLELPFITAKDRHIWVRAQGEVEMHNGRIVRMFGAFQDITERKQAESAMRLRIAAVVFDTQEPIFITDAHYKIQRVNHAFTELTGYAVDEAVGQTPRLLLSDRNFAEIETNMWVSLYSHHYWKGQFWHRKRSGEEYLAQLAMTAIVEGNNSITHYVGVFSDITLVNAAQKKIEYLAFYDELTKLPNRRLLLDRIQHALVSFTRSHQHGALMFIDLDDFKKLNDTLGHDMGDLLLQQVASRLSSCVREIDTVARLGGDEFVVMLHDMGLTEIEAQRQAMRIAEKIQLALNKVYELDTHQYRCTPSIGVTVFDDTAANPEAVLKQSDIAMYASKSSGKNKLHMFVLPCELSE